MKYFKGDIKIKITILLIILMVSIGFLNDCIETAVSSPTTAQTFFEKINESQIEIQKKINSPDSSHKANLKEIPEFLENGISVVQLPDRLNNVIPKNINQSEIKSLNNPPVDYFYECNFYPYDGDGDGDNESILAEFDVDTLNESDYVTVVGGLFDDDDNLIDFNWISYWVYGYEWDYEYLDFTAFWNGTIGWDTYYVLLFLYDSNDELDDWCYSPNISLYVNPYDLFWECNFYPYDEEGDGYNDSILAEFDVDTLQILISPFYGMGQLGGILTMFSFYYMILLGSLMTIGFLQIYPYMYLTSQLSVAMSLMKYRVSQLRMRK